MKRVNFVSLIMGTIGGILFAIGMCMGLLPEWGAFTQGIVIGCVGLVVLIAMLIVRRKMEGKPAIHLSWNGASRHCRRTSVGYWYVHGNGVGYDDFWYHRRYCRYRVALSSDSDLQRFEVGGVTL